MKNINTVKHQRLKYLISDWNSNDLGRLMPLVFGKWHDFFNVAKWSVLQFYSCSESSTYRTGMTPVTMPAGVIKCSRQNKRSCYWIRDPMCCSTWIYLVGIVFEYWPSLTLFVRGGCKIITQSNMATGHQYQHPEDLTVFLAFSWMCFLFKVVPFLIYQGTLFWLFFRKTNYRKSK